MKRSRLMVACLGLSAMLWDGPAVAFVQEVTANFRPDPSNPNVNRFTNTTPVSGYCANAPAVCEYLNIFSIRMPVVFESSAPLAAVPTDPRQTSMWTVPVQWRPLTVVNAFGEQETVEIRISGIGSRYTLDRRVDEVVPGPVDLYEAHDRLWRQGFWTAPSPCRAANSSGLGWTYVSFFWMTPQEGNCVKTAQFEIPSLRYDYTDIAYELRTPNPLGMSSGVYTGTLTYGIGPYQDFDMGDVMLPNDSALTLNFTLDVQHVLKVDIPPGGNRVELLPQGGWQAWLNRGRQPARLFRDQTFRIHASSRFKMSLECGLVIGNTCGLRNADGNEAPVQLAVSLPGGITDQYGQPANRRALRLDGAGTELFQPAHYISDRPGTLHFEVERDDVSDMLEYPGSTYVGVVTVVWDSEV
ncbi:hypothetical protein [Pseudomonas sp. EYE_354]|uniref:hypothetical protein n=1 Tax=Pseudomonas sp. EYE_354 TaxID=2853449 RepID=UPI002006BE05|nr:hypothetical protein [Pseudomonas sp. EYE_354]MCK6186475.1 hypothetical protein [Pseudomonas sp. EYE_354]